MNYPDDENGDVLGRMEAAGDNLRLPRNVDFTVVFPDEIKAELFAGHFRQQGYTVSVAFTETEKDLPWDAVVVKFMTPSHQQICDFEPTLQVAAEPLGGRNDGWGCFSEPN